MVRTIMAILAGLAAFAAVAGIATLVARAGWPAYAAVEKQRAYTLGMYLARLGAGMVATLAAGATTAWVDLGVKRTVFMAAAVLLLVSALHHIRIWDQYPVWYHLFYLAYLIPLTLQGGKLLEPKTARHG